MIYILQYQGTSFISRMIEAVTWSRYSHSAIANDFGGICEVWEGNGGMMAFSPWENHTPGTVVDIYALSAIGKDQRIWNEALLRVGTKYDFLSILGFLPVLRHWWKDDPDKYFCSHYVAECCRLGGAPLFSPETPLYKLSPGVLPWSPRLKKVATVKDEEEWERFLDANPSNP